MGNNNNLIEVLENAADQVFKTIRQIIASEYGISVYAIIIVKAKSLIRTTSGKVRRNPTRELYLANKLAVLYQWTADTLLSDQSQPDFLSTETVNVKIILSHEQQALWYLHQLNPESTAYNVSVAIRLKKIDINACRKIWLEILEAYAILRSRFILKDTEIIQQVEPAQAQLIQEITATYNDENSIKQYLNELAQQPFLSHACL